MKKLVSILLSVIMVVCFMPSMAFAATTSPAMTVQFKYHDTVGTATVSSTGKSASLKVTGTGLRLLPGIRNYKAGTATIVCGSSSVKFTSKDAVNGKISMTSTVSCLPVEKAILDRFTITETGEDDTHVVMGKGITITKTGTSTAVIKVPGGTKVEIGSKAFALSKIHDMTVKVEGITASKVKTGSLDDKNLEDIARIFDSFIAAASGKNAKVTVSYEWTDAYKKELGKRVEKTNIINLKANTSKKNSFTLSWGRTDTNVTIPYYKVLISRDGGKTYRSRTVSSKTTTFTECVPGKTYYVQVQGYRILGGVKYTTPVKKLTVVNGKTYMANTKAAVESTKIVNVKSTATSTHRVKLSWSKSKNVGMTGYKVYRATSKKGTYKVVLTTKNKSYTSSKLTKGKTYYFKVRGYRTVGGKTYYTPYSSIKAVKVR